MLNPRNRQKTCTLSRYFKVNKTKFVFLRNFIVQYLHRIYLSLCSLTKLYSENTFFVDGIIGLLSKSIEIVALIIRYGQINL